MLTRSPSPGEILNVVTEGPAVHPVTREVRPNSSSVAWSLRATAASSSSELAESAEVGFEARIESGGSW